MKLLSGGIQVEQLSSYHQLLQKFLAPSYSLNVEQSTVKQVLRFKVRSRKQRKAGSKGRKETGREKSHNLKHCHSRLVSDPGISG